jgi:hypothetical protein
LNLIQNEILAFFLVDAFLRMEIYQIHLTHSISLMQKKDSSLLIVPDLTKLIFCFLLLRCLHHLMRTRLNHLNHPIFIFILNLLHHLFVSIDFYSIQAFLLPKLLLIHIFLYLSSPLKRNADHLNLLCLLQQKMLLK